jgi:ferritin-like metal-binding protein YciE
MPRSSCCRPCHAWRRPRPPPELQNAFSNHLKETENHVARLEQSFKDLGMPMC